MVEDDAELKEETDIAEEGVCHSSLVLGPALAAPSYAGEDPVPNNLLYIYKWK